MCELCNETGWREHTESDEVMGLITVSELCDGCLENDECPVCGENVVEYDDEYKREHHRYCKWCERWWEVD